MSDRIEDRARRIAEPFLEKNNCLLWDVLFEKEGAMHYLKILFDDNNGALDMDKCERLTPPLNKLLDAEEFIKQVDIVEIGSPGLTRRLRRKEHFDFCKNKNIRVMKRLENGKTEFVSGVLTGYDTENKSITLNGEEKMNLKKCIRITLEEQPQ
ncbi:MAG: ribosome assembly cofactor RimP [Oscillospiraceae bacterium]|nr:ribosome assembly cofactor RimP [Oscillospiraceae bacterium]